MSTPTTGPSHDATYFITALYHYAKPWQVINHTWQTRTLDFQLATNAEIHFDPAFPRIAIITDRAETEDINDWFSCQQEEIGQFLVLYFPNVPKSVPMSEVFQRISVTAEDHNKKRSSPE